MYGNFDNKEMRELSSISLSFGGSLTCKIGMHFGAFIERQTLRDAMFASKNDEKIDSIMQLLESQKNFQEAMNIRMTNLEIQMAKNDVLIFWEENSSFIRINEVFEN